jgi:hypothetical protein
MTNRAATHATKIYKGTSIHIQDCAGIVLMFIVTTIVHMTPTTIATHNMFRFAIIDATMPTKTRKNNRIMDNSFASGLCIVDVLDLFEHSGH